MINNFLDKEGLQILWEIIKDNDNQLEESIKNIICPGYFYEGEFYIDDQHIRKYVPYTYKLYVEVSTSKIYAYINNEYKIVGNMPEQADEHTAGISKLYKSKGINEDGSVTQKCFTESINQKVGAELNDEILVLTRDN